VVQAKQRFIRYKVSSAPSRSGLFRLLHQKMQGNIENPEGEQYACVHFGAFEAASNGKSSLTFCFRSIWKVARMHEEYVARGGRRHELCVVAADW
jgi:hypothetical protein